MRKLFWIVRAFVSIVLILAPGAPVKAQLRAQSLPPAGAAVPTQTEQGVADRSRELSRLFNTSAHDKLKHHPIATYLGDSGIRRELTRHSSARVNEALERGRPYRPPFEDRHQQCLGSGAAPPT